MITPLISLIAFDLDGVLYDFLPAKRLAYLSNLTGRDPAWIQSTIWDSDFEPAAECGAYTTGDDYLNAFNQRLGFKLSRDQWITARRLAMIPRPDMLALLKTLQPHLQLAVLTNNGVLMRETLPSLVPELWELIGEHIHVTADFRARKPDPTVFVRLAKLYDCEPTTILFIDDNAENVAGARSAGLQAIQFESPAQVRTLVSPFVANLD